MHKIPMTKRKMNGRIIKIKSNHKHLLSKNHFCDSSLTHNKKIVRLKTLRNKHNELAAS